MSYIYLYQHIKVSGKYIGNFFLFWKFKILFILNLWKPFMHQSILGVLTLDIFGWNVILFGLKVFSL